jgi:hypothetical protein
MATPDPAIASGFLWKGLDDGPSRARSSFFLGALTVTPAGRSLRVRGKPNA